MLSLSSKFALWYHSITYRWEWWQWEWSQWKVNMLLIFKRFLSKSFSRKLLHLLFFPFFVSFIFLKPEILQCLKTMNGLLHLKWKKSYAKDLNSWNLQSNRLSKINLRVKFLLRILLSGKNLFYMVHTNSNNSANWQIFCVHLPRINPKRNVFINKSSENFCNS